MNPVGYNQENVYCLTYASGAKRKTASTSNSEFSAKHTEINLICVFHWKSAEKVMFFVFSYVFLALCLFLASRSAHLLIQQVTQTNNVHLYDMQPYVNISKFTRTAIEYVPDKIKRSFITVVRGFRSARNSQFANSNRKLGPNPTARG